MQKRIAVGLVVAVVGVTIGFVAATTRPTSTLAGQLVDLDPPTESSGTGESLVVVVGGAFNTPVDAQAWVDDNQFGDMQGFYAVPAREFVVNGPYVNDNAEVVDAACDPEVVMCDPATQPTVTLMQNFKLRYLGAGAFLDLQQTEIGQVIGVTCGAVGRPACISPIVQRVDPETEQFIDPYLAVTAFRTKVGAEEFLQLPRALGDFGPLLVVRVTKVGVLDVGLGQERSPDDSGPLTHELGGQIVYQ